MFASSATLATILVFGWILLISGVIELVEAFRTGTWSGFFLYLLGALLRGFTGYLLIAYPAVGAVTATLLLAMLFIVGGLFRAIAAGMAKFPRWGWAVCSGIISVALGVMLMAQMPTTALWFIGFAIGVDLIFDGLAVIGFATAIHHLPSRTAFGTA